MRSALPTDRWKWFDTTRTTLALGAVLVGVAVYLLLRGPELVPYYLALPVLLILAVALSFSLLEQLRQERHRRLQAEQEGQQIRLLLDMVAVFSETQATRDFVRNVGRFVEGACPGLLCRVMLRGTNAEERPADSAAGHAFPLRAHGREYGQLWVYPTQRTEPSDHEQWLCQMVAQTVAGALYTTEQSSAAQAASEIREQLLAIVSHEFRTPLHAIHGYVDMLDSSLNLETETVTRESIERLRANAYRLQDLFEEALIFVELEAGRRTIRAETFRIEEIMKEVAPAVTEQLSGSGATFSWRIGEGAETVCSDRRKLQRVVASVLGHAAKLTRAGWVSLTVARDGEGWVEFIIADTGIGIPSADLEVLFQEVRPVDGAFNRRASSLGLGLPLARELVSLLGGQIRVDSHVGEGTTVRLRLPQSIVGRHGHQTIVLGRKPDSV